MEPSLANRAALLHDLVLAKCRRDFCAFVGYAFGLQLADHHRTWVNAVENHRRVVLLAPVDNGKSTIFSVAYPIWLLGRDPNALIALISETATQASKPLSAIREQIIGNARVHEVFPQLRPAESRETWSTSQVVVERSVPSKDPSILAVGVFGPLLGARLTHAILDDVCSHGNTWTETQRKSVISWFRSTLVGRLTPEGRVLVLGTPWHPEDLLGELQRSTEYVTVKTPAITPTGEAVWPQRWPLERLEQRRREVGDLEYSRQMLLEVLSDSASRFKLEWFEAAFKKANEVGLTLVDSYSGPHPTFSGVDLGVGQSERNDSTVIFTIAQLPEGRRRVLSIQRGKFQAPEVVALLADTQRRFRSRLRVESNGAQQFVSQWLKAQGIAVEAHTTTARNKADPVFGVESLAIELEAGLWSIPDAPTTRAWARECISYRPEDHTPDGLMAAWFAREACRAAEGGAPFPVPFLVGRSVRPFADYRARGIFVARTGQLPDEDWENFGRRGW